MGKEQELPLDPAYTDGPYYVVDMPINANGTGPEMDPAKVQITLYEVWNGHCLSLGQWPSRALAQLVADALNRRSSDEQAEVVGWPITAESYVYEFVRRGEKNTRKLAPWEQAYQDADLIEAARRHGYINIAGNVACDVTVTDRGRWIAEIYGRALYAPPAVAAGGVTEAMSTPVMRAVAECLAGLDHKEVSPRAREKIRDVMVVSLSGGRTAVKDAIDMCERYAEFIRRIPSANLEEHPYLPELEDVIEALAALAVGIREGADACPVCAVTFKPDDMCQTDIEMGTCHAACLEGSPLVDLETGEPLPEGSEWPAPYRYDSLIPTPPSRGEGE